MKEILMRAAVATFAMAAATGVAAEAYSGTWDEAWDASQRPAESKSYAVAAVEASLDSRIAGVEPSAETAADSRYRDVKETPGIPFCSNPCAFTIVLR